MRVSCVYALRFGILFGYLHLQNYCSFCSTSYSSCQHVMMRLSFLRTLLGISTGPYWYVQNKQQVYLANLGRS